MDENLTDTQAEETFSEIQGALNNMMTSSLQYFPPFISCIQVNAFNCDPFLECLIGVSVFPNVIYIIAQPETPQT